MPPVGRTDLNLTELELSKARSGQANIFSVSVWISVADRGICPLRKEVPKSMKFMQKKTVTDI